MYKALFWALMFAFYAVIFLVYPAAQEGSWLTNIAVAHLAGVGTFGFAFLVGFLHDKAFN